jgi:O-succinylbenzoate synthase
VSIGIQPTLEGLLARVDKFVAEGYDRIKVKIEQGWKMTPLLRALRERHPDLRLMADANSAFLFQINGGEGDRLCQSGLTVYNK